MLGSLGGKKGFGELRLSELEDLKWGQGDLEKKS